MSIPATQMERRVAAVLAARAGLVPNDGAIERHLGDARAAIRAMREPTHEMLMAGSQSVPLMSVVWDDMITAASPESP